MKWGVASASHGVGIGALSEEHFNHFESGQVTGLIKGSQVIVEMTLKPFWMPSQKTLSLVCVPRLNGLEELYPRLGEYLGD